MEELSEKIEILERMMDDLEPNYKAQWEELSDDYKLGMINGIIAFEVKVHELQFQEKLSQNKKENERQNIIESFSVSDQDNEKLIAEYMLKNESND